MKPPFTGTFIQFIVALWASQMGCLSLSFRHRQLNGNLLNGMLQRGVRWYFKRVVRGILKCPDNVSFT